MLNYLQRRCLIEKTRAATYRSNYQKTSQAKYNENPKSYSLLIGAATSYIKNSQNNQLSKIYKKIHMLHVVKVIIHFYFVMKDSPIWILRTTIQVPPINLQIMIEPISQVKHYVIMFQASNYLSHLK